MRRFVLLLLAVSVLPDMHASAQQKYRVVRVAVTGSSRCPQELLVRATGLVLNSTATADQLQEAANRLGTSGVFSSVQFVFKPAAGPNGVEADFMVQDATQFLPAVFENFVGFTDQQLQEEIQKSVPLFCGVLPTRGSMPDDVSAALSGMMASRGLPSDVSYVLIGDVGQPPSGYAFKINNADLRIHGVTIRGSRNIEAAKLSAALNSLQGRPYLRSEVAEIVNSSVLPLYLQQGYLKAAITAIEARPAPNNLVDVAVTLTEGDQYRVGKYEWSGNTLISSTELSRGITLKPGEPVDAVRLDEDLRKLRRQFANFGREAATITPVPEFQGDTVNYLLQVQEGDPYHMGKLEIVGMDAANTAKLMQSWKLKPGDVYDKSYADAFTSHIAVRTESRRVEWEMREQIDDPDRLVNVRLQLRVDPR